MAQMDPEWRERPASPFSERRPGGITDRLGQDIQGDPIRVSFNGVPLVAFINEVFGTELGMSFIISAGLQQKTDLVTLRLTEPLSPSQLFATARRVLQEYGVDLREEEGILTFVASQEITSRDIPLLISGRTLPVVPPTHRMIFQLVPLRVVRGRQVTGWLKLAFPGDGLKIMEDPDRNALLLMGGMNMIAEAIAMIEVFDQPLLQGRYGVIIEPNFLEVKDLAEALRQVLVAEGYQVSVGQPGGSSILVPLEDLHKLVVFAADQRALEHIKEWSRILDEKEKDEIEEAVFTYEVQNTQAAEMTETLNQMLTSSSESLQPMESFQGGLRTPATMDGVSAPQSGQNRIVVDENTNLLIFRGSGKEWAEILSILDKIDKPVPSVLIEVLIAEITLTDEEGSGFEFLFNSSVDDFGVTGGTLDALGVSSKALSMVLDSAGQTRAVLNLFYEESRVSIRSNPKLLVKSGETASIEVGNEIPVISQISEEGTQVGGTTNILQQVTYRKTGVLLDITAIVQANGLVDLEISQTLSEARPTASTSLEGTPTILNRSIATSLTLRDGGSLLMGGLISDNQSSGQAGVPGLGRLPLIGRLFRVDSFQQDRTELMIMVTPYVITSHEEGTELTERLNEQLELHKAYLE